MKRSLSCFVLLLILGSFYVSAQDSELTIKAGPEFPLGNFKSVYKTGYNISVGAYSLFGGSMNYAHSYGAYIGFSRWQPERGEVNLFPGTPAFINTTYGDYRMLQFMAGYKFAIRVNDYLEIVPAVHSGVYFVWYKNEYDDAYISYSETSIEAKTAIVPSLGLNFPVSENIGMTINSLFHLYYTVYYTGWWDYNYYDPYYYAYSDFQIYHSISAGLYFRF